MRTGRSSSSMTSRTLRSRSVSGGCACSRWRTSRAAAAVCLEIGVGRVRLQPLADFAGRGGGLLAADEGVRPGEYQEDLAVALDLGQGSEGRLQAGKREGRLVPIVKRALARSPGPARRLPG